MPVHSSKSTNATFRRAAVCIANFKHSKCNKHITASFQPHAVLARARDPTTRTQTDLRQHTTYRTSLSLLTSFIPNLSQSRRACFSAPSIPITYPPRIRATADSQAADHVSCGATPARKRDTRLAAAGFRPPFSGLHLTHTHIYIYYTFLVEVV